MPKVGVVVPQLLTPYWQTTDGETVRLFQGDVLDVLKRLPSQSVQTTITSPPYWGLRSYLDSAHDDKHRELGSEKSPDCLGWARGENCAERDWRNGCHVCRIVLVFREIRRVMRDDATCWLNYGSSYGPDGQLVWIPARVALALQSDSWVLRQDIIWSKKSAMPESVQNRCTKSHEYVFLLTKGTRYFYDAEAVKEPLKVSDEEYALMLASKRKQNSTKAGSSLDAGAGRKDDGFNSFISDGKTETYIPSGANKRSVWSIDDDRALLDYLALHNPELLERFLSEQGYKSDVWRIASQGYPGAHYACVDAETEALTKTGWKKHADLRDGEWIAAYDRGTGLLSWQSATFHRYDYDGEMVVFDKRDTSQWLTPNHRCIVMHRGKKGYRVDVKRAEHLNGRDHFLMTARFTEEPENSIGVDMAALLGWYTSEGCRGYGESIHISQSVSANPEKVEEIKQLLYRLKARFSIRHSDKLYRGVWKKQANFVVKGLVAMDLLNICPGNKEITDEMTCLPPEELEALLNAFIDGDGHTRPEDGRCSIIQKDKRRLEQLQVIAVKLGYRAHMSHRNDGAYCLYLTKGEWLTLRAADGKWSGLDMRHYRGCVWCPSVPSNFWLARRDGKPFITGNTFPPKLIEPMILAGTSAKGACANCGSPWRRVTKPDKATAEAQEKARNGEDWYQRAWDNSDKRSRDKTGNKEEAGYVSRYETLRWEPTCTCHGEFMKRKVVTNRAKGSVPTGWAVGSDDHSASGHQTVEGRSKVDLDGVSETVTETLVEYVPSIPLDEHPIRPCIVLDPFIGSGTCAVVALGHGRQCWGIDLSTQYLRENAIPRIKAFFTSRPDLRHMVERGVKSRVLGRVVIQGGGGLTYSHRSL